MKIAVLSDIHANHNALEAVLERVYAGNFDRMILLGDYVTDCPYPQETLSLLRNIPARYSPVFIRGNREDYVIAHARGLSEWKYGSKCGGLLYTYENLTCEDIQWFETLPISLRVEYEGCPPIIACHGAPHKTNYLFQTDTPEAEALADSIDCGVLLCGHSHAPYIFRHGKKQIINAGALGIPKNGQTAAQFMSLSYEGGEWSAELVSVPYDIERTVSEFFTSGLLEKSRVWGRAVIGTLRCGINYSVYCVHEVERLALETGLSVYNESLWERAAENIGIPQV